MPFLHFFDGFRTSHELGPVDLLTADDLDACSTTTPSPPIGPGAVIDYLVLRGPAQNPDVVFQAREAAAPYHRRYPAWSRTCSPPSPSAPVAATASSTTKVPRTPTG